MNEIWKDIINFEGLYQISNLGNVKSLPKKVKKKYGFRNTKEKLLKKVNHSAGYYIVGLKKNKRDYKFFIHRLLAIHYIDNPNNFLCINHIDGDKQNNNLNNLEWCTKQENNKHAFKNNLINNTGINNGMSKLTEKDVLFIRENKYNFLQKELAIMFNVTKNYICGIINYRNRKYL